MTNVIYKLVVNMKEIRETEIFKAWFADIRDIQVKSRIDTRIKRLAMGNPGDNRFLGDISELRIDYGPGYRVYFKDTGREIIILLCGGDKSTQSRDIKLARKLAKSLEGIGWNL